MRSRTSATAVVAALSVLLTAAGHAFVSAHPVPASAWPQLVALGAACFLLGHHGLRLRSLVPALAGIQAGLHLALVSVAQPHTAAPAVHAGHGAHDHHAAVADSLLAATVPPVVRGGPAMFAVHLGALLGTVLLLRQAQRWWQRLGTALARDAAGATGSARPDPGRTAACARTGRRRAGGRAVADALTAVRPGVQRWETCRT